MKAHLSLQAVIKAGTLRLRYREVRPKSVRGERKERCTVNVQILAVLCLRSFIVFRASETPELQRPLAVINLFNETRGKERK